MEDERMRDEQLCVWSALCKIWDGCPAQALVKINEFIYAKVQLLSGTAKAHRFCFTCLHQVLNAYTSTY